MKRILFLILICIPSCSFAKGFSPDSIPVAEGKVVFTKQFETDLDKEEIRVKVKTFLEDQLNPYSKRGKLNNPNKMVYHVIDYIHIKSIFVHIFAMYMMYDLQIDYKDNLCTVSIKDISFMEKRYFEAKTAEANSTAEVNLYTHSGESVLVEKKYKQLMVKQASQKITYASIVRINEVFNGIEDLLLKE